MRMVIIVVAALVTLGLAAFGIVAVQKATKTTLASAPAAPTSISAAADQNARIPATHPTALRLTDASAATIAATPAASSLPVPAAPTRVAENIVPGATLATATPAAGTTVPAHAAAACDKPDGMGLARTIEIDTTGGPGFGFEHFKQYDFLRDREVVLTFDDGPWPENTAAVLKALADNCIKATFFEIGEHAMWHPEITKRVVEAGNTLGSHTWSHKDLARNPYADDLDRAKAEVEMGVSAVHLAAGTPIAPFFRFPDLQHPPALLSYLAERNIATFSTDIDSFDFKMRKPEQVIKSVMSKLEKRGKGIILMHDFQHATAEAMPELLRQLKLAGYKVVHMMAREPLTALAQYDEMVAKTDKLAVTNTRPVSSVVRTLGE